MLRNLIVISMIAALFACSDDDSSSNDVQNPVTNDDYAGVYIGTAVDKGTAFGFPVDETYTDTMYIFKEGQDHYLSDTSVFIKAVAIGKFNNDKVLSSDTIADGADIIYNATVKGSTLTTDIKVDAGELYNITSTGTYEKQ
ncbi:MAG: hypothetical protein CNE98_03020 [Bacteroidetes bacterium MED-G17]|nr:MAG: hypothetical protein CNE98_03020 [Bacteroidetes bacterium MED-G17]|tara:strand:- start:1173 stop:1595 length:423 start_codon:yes stop_codon:yes gene_type:complete